MAFLLCLLGAKRLLADDAGEKKEKRQAEDHAARLRIEGLVAVRGCVLQELDFNPLKSISTVEKRDPRRKKEKV